MSLKVPKFRNIAYLEDVYNSYFSPNFVAVFFFEFIVTRVSVSKYSSGFPQSVIVLELKLIAVELTQEEAVIDLMWSYRAAPCVALNLYYILSYLIMKEVELDTLTSYNTDTREGQLLKLFCVRSSKFQ